MNPSTCFASYIVCRKRECVDWPKTATFFCEGRPLPSNYSISDEKNYLQHENCSKNMSPVKPGRTNKRDERGSTDEETKEPKRVNMASADFEPEDSEEHKDNQPDLVYIHALLKDIQKSICRIKNLFQATGIGTKNRYRITERSTQVQRPAQN